MGFVEIDVGCYGNIQVFDCVIYWDIDQLVVGFVCQVVYVFVFGFQYLGGGYWLFGRIEIVSCFVSCVDYLDILFF